MTGPTLGRSPSRVIRREVILALLGITFWAVGAILLRLLSPLGALDENWRLVTYAGILFGTWPFVLIVMRLARLRPGEALNGVALVTTVALFIDGMVFGWAPGIYGEVAYQRLCAAAVLWGAGCGLFLAYVEDVRAARR